MRKKKSILRRNLAFSLGFGVCMGLVFPIYSLFFVEFKSPLLGIFFAFGCVIAGILVGIFGYLINTRAVVAMAHRINGVIEELSQGHPVDYELLRVDSDDILGRMIDNFRKGIVMFSDSIGLLRQTAERTLEMSDEVGINIAETMDNTQVLSRTIDLIGDAAEDLDRQNDLMELGFDHLSKATLLNMANVIELFTNINDFGSTIFIQTESLDKLVETIRGIEASIGGAGKDAGQHTLASLQENLDRRVTETIATAMTVFNGIKARLDAIDGIAERTNVLSINAAIESARLGVAGGGFRIIAGNIKVLAEEVHSLTARIGVDMKEGEAALDAATGSLSGAIRSQSEIIGGIRNSIGSLAERNSDATDQMATMGQIRGQIDGLLADIKENMQNLKTQVVETRESLKAVVNTSTVIHSGISVLTEKSSAIAGNGARVNSSLETFKSRVGEITLGKREGA